MFNTRELRPLVNEVSKIRKVLQEKDSLADKLIDNLFAVGNLVLAGVVFAQFLPNSKPNWFIVLTGLLASIIIYGSASTIKRRKQK